MRIIASDKELFECTLALPKDDTEQDILQVPGFVQVDSQSITSFKISIQISSAIVSAPLIL